MTVKNDRLPSSDTLPRLDWLAQHAEPAPPGHFNELRGSAEPSDTQGLTPTWSTFFQLSALTNPNQPQLFPLLLTAQDWQGIAQGVLQRVQLLEQVMADVYGPQRVLHQALLPPALVLGHPDYIRALRGVTPVGETHLHTVALDLVRSPQGPWWVVAQHTQTPAGLGDVLENRSRMTQRFPQAFNALQIQPLNHLGQDWMAALRQRCPTGADAHIVMLASGATPANDAGAASLARALGVPLVTGHDLTVRDQHLYLNTAHGPVPVHGLLKHLDDALLDPLALRADATLGVPGLLQVIQARHVLVANAPGSGFLESPALLGFLPALCEALRGETLRLPSLPTWWCGERAVFNQVQYRLASSVIKPSFPWGLPGLPHRNPVRGRELSAHDQDVWRARMAQQSEDFSLQDEAPFSHMPVWHATDHGGRLELQKISLRVFAIAQQPGQWEVLPGGLAQLSSPEQNCVDMPRERVSTDVWVSSACAPTAESH